MTAPSQRPGMGATPYSGGVTFRVWAPFAQTVALFGDFATWDDPGLPLAREDSSHWSIDVDGAQPGQNYKFKVNGAWRIDPHARAVTHSVGDGIIVGSDFPWAHPFSMPRTTSAMSRAATSLSTARPMVGPFQFTLERLQPGLRQFPGA